MSHAGGTLRERAERRRRWISAPTGACIAAGIILAPKFFTPSGSVDGVMAVLDVVVFVLVYVGMQALLARRPSPPDRGPTLWSAPLLQGLTRSRRRAARRAVRRAEPSADPELREAELDTAVRLVRAGRWAPAVTPVLGLGFCLFAVTADLTGVGRAAFLGVAALAIGSGVWAAYQRPRARCYLDRDAAARGAGSAQDGGAAK
ncbi:hypothetical protein SAMN05443575_2169 [Jatrophihabitans endophyticus]|uniref:Uncharacterized protein n=1 Tax=Jatrophihabitans endophyticus TaxID=1206085 RepID=A0A1M5KIL6_9ACTN|nr:hypothetical protein [Jatrophihabitans endophyticus]SHG52617.1 hypothetical protein SAMN05443575_2169 [Jatrophihabitans endophyticus]